MRILARDNAQDKTQSIRSEKLTLQSVRQLKQEAPEFYRRKVAGAVSHFGMDRISLCYQGAICTGIYCKLD